jgi:radical SAM superfamily enzyme YgiQ (UPF0313 family)
MFVGEESFSRKTLLAAHKTQNHPEAYGEIVRLCRKYGINAHFSNIIAFPNETAADIREHLRVLRSLEPPAASFYILTPVPGTDQYADFLAAGRIHEKNLDRFDSLSVTWTHDLLSSGEITDLLFECYRKFYSTGKIMRAAASCFRYKPVSAGPIPSLGLSAFGRYCGWKRIHPMSGGMGTVLLDKVSDYGELRRSRFGLDLVPLPQNLQLSKSDEELNKRVKIAM